MVDKNDFLELWQRDDINCLDSGYIEYEDEIKHEDNISLFQNHIKSQNICSYVNSDSSLESRWDINNNIQNYQLDDIINWNERNCEEVINGEGWSIKNKDISVDACWQNKNKFNRYLDHMKIEKNTSFILPNSKSIQNKRDK